MASIFSGVAMGATTIPVSMAVRPTFYREKAGGYYLPVFWAVCELLLEVVWCLPDLVVTVLPSYWMIGLQADAAVFFKYLFSTFLLFMSYVSLAQLYSSISPSQGAAQILNSGTASLLKAFSGISIPLSKVPKGWKWLYYILPNQHIFNGIVMNQFEGNSGELTIFKDNQAVTLPIRDYVASYLGWSFGDMWPNVGWAILFIGVVQIFHFLGVMFISHNKL